jgi:hypothetical protein
MSSGLSLSVPGQSLAEELGNIAKAARDLDVTESSLTSWIKQAKIFRCASPCATKLAACDVVAACPGPIVATWMNGWEPETRLLGTVVNCHLPQRHLVDRRVVLTWLRASEIIKVMKDFAAALAPLVLIVGVTAQSQSPLFGPSQLITSTTDGARSVFAIDLDGDGDADVLSASSVDDKIACYLNDGSGAFSQPIVISTLADGASSVFAIDLDGDGDADVLSASSGDDKIAWYENFGFGFFGAQQVITTAADGANSVFAIDLDGDGDADVLSASSGDDKIAWYENQGGGVFGPQLVIMTPYAAKAVCATDLDGDGDADVLSMSPGNGALFYVFNDGVGNFSGGTISLFSPPSALAASDIDGDGDADMLVALASEIRIYENNGTGPSGQYTTVPTSVGEGVGLV